MKNEDRPCIECGEKTRTPDDNRCTECGIQHAVDYDREQAFLEHQKLCNRAIEELGGRETLIKFLLAKCKREMVNSTCHPDELIQMLAGYLLNDAPPDADNIFCKRCDALSHPMNFCKRCVSELSCPEEYDPNECFDEIWAQRAHESEIWKKEAERNAPPVRVVRTLGVDPASDF